MAYYKVSNILGKPKNNKLGVIVNSSSLVQHEPFSDEIKANYFHDYGLKFVENHSTVDPKIWGPIQWANIHINTRHFSPKTEEDIERMVYFVLGISSSPCDVCNEHSRKWIEENQSEILNAIKSANIEGNSRKLFNLFVDLHNKVNDRQKKKRISSAYAWDYYETMNVGMK